MSFDYAYSPFTQGASDTLTILISTDCGETYQTLTKMFGAGLQTANATTSPFVPNAIQWKNKALSLTAYANNPYAKIIFRNTSSHENNLYIDNINILGSPTGIENMSNSIPLSLFPNPAYGKVNVTYPMLEGNSEVLIEMIDMAGKTVQVWKEKATHGVNQWELQLPDASKGVYLLRFQNGYHTQAERLIVE
jgi:hypothetical protein